MKVLSLFSGAGGFDMGLEQAGMEVVYQCEIEKKCRLVLKRHWPDVPLHDDVSTLTGKMVLDAVGSVDVVAWGSPCQDLSVAGGRSGLEGNKSGLFHEGIRIIRELREESNNESPAWSIWENVRGAFSSNHGRDFATVIDQMGEAGAVEIEWRLLDAQFFGVPQRRKRIFIVAGFNPRADNADAVFALTESVRWDSSTSAKEREEIAGTLGSGSGTRSGQEEAAAGLMVAVSVEQMTFIPPTYPTITTDFGDKLCQNNQAVDGGYLLVTPIHDQATRWAGKNGEKTAGKGNGLGIGEPGDPIPTLTRGDRHAVFIENEPFVKSRRAQSTEDYETWVADAPSPTLNAFDNATETRATVIVPIAFDSNWSGRYDVMDSGLSPTIKSTQPPPAVAEMAVRRLTPRECERLMGWPDDHTLLGSDDKEITDGHRYKMCGDGVVSSVAKWVGEQVMRADDD